MTRHYTGAEFARALGLPTMSEFSKSIDTGPDQVKLSISQGWPRWVQFRCNRTNISFTVVLDTARDMHALLGNLIRQADDEDARMEQLRGKR